MTYTIKQMAAMFGVTEHTLRYYTDLGLLPCKRTGGGRRVFDDESVNWMQGIQCLQGCGFSMEEVGQYCALCMREESEANLRARYRMILKAQDDAYQRLEAAKANAAYVEQKVKHYENILAGRTADDSNPKNWTAKTRPNAHKDENPNIQQKNLDKNSEKD